MIWKFLKQNVLSAKGLNWVQHLVSQIGLLLSSKKKLLTTLCIFLRRKDEESIVKQALLDYKSSF